VRVCAREREYNAHTLGSTGRGSDPVCVRERAHPSVCVCV
jgi:hypothetical protein